MPLEAALVTATDGCTASVDTLNPPAYPEPPAYAAAPAEGAGEIVSNMNSTVPEFKPKGSSTVSPRHREACPIQIEAKLSLTRLERMFAMLRLPGIIARIVLYCTYVFLRRCPERSQSTDSRLRPLPVHRPI